MVSLEAMRASIAMEAEGLHGVALPMTINSPIPGLMVFADEGHQRLEMLRPDGTAIDLLKVWRLAEDCVRNWQKEGTMPGFVGDFKRLAPLAEALNGRKVDTSAIPR